MMALPGMAKAHWFEEPVSVWNEENAKDFVVAVMRILLRWLPLEHERRPLIKQAHSVAEKGRTSTQPQYDLAFGNALREILKTDRFMGLGQHLLEDQYLLHPPLIPTSVPVATEKPITAAKVFATPKATAYEGPAFDIPGVALLPGTVKPAAPKPLEKPDLTAKSRPVLEQSPSKVSRKHAKKNPGGRAIIYHAPDQIPMAPWGLPAVELCEWAWRLIEADDHSKMSMNQLYNCAKILSVLVYAGVVPPNSIIPMGMTNKNFGGKY